MGEVISNHADGNRELGYVSYKMQTSPSCLGTQVRPKFPSPVTTAGGFCFWNIFRNRQFWDLMRGKLDQPLIQLKEDLSLVSDPTK